MQRLTVGVGVLLFLGLVSAPVAAQDIPEEARRHIHQEVLGSPALVFRGKVQDELRLTDEQKKKVDEAVQGQLHEATKLFGKLGGLEPQEREKHLGEYRAKAAEKLTAFLKETLTGEQLKRLHQVMLQQEGLLAIGNPEVMKELEFTDQQRRQFMEVVKAFQEKLESAMKEAQTEDRPEEIHAKAMQLRKEHEAKIEAILMDAQKRKWRELLGKPLDLGDGRSMRSFGPKNGLIALTLRDRHGRLQVFTIRPDGAGRSQLTTEGDNGRPVWSPDGKRIAFMSVREGKKPAVWVMDADGTEPKLLAEGLTPAWSPDGAKIAYASFDAQICVMDADGSNRRQITTSNTHKVGPSWSPDGKQMVFILVKNPGSQTDPQPAIGIMNADGTKERVLTKEDRTNIKVNPGGQPTLLGTARDANAPSWSPVGSKIAFWSGIENEYGQVWTVDADGTGSKQLTDAPTGINNDDPSWSPDGKWILFGTNRDGRNELWVMAADGCDPRRVSDLDAGPFPGRASWQPIPPTPFVGRIAYPARDERGVSQIVVAEKPGEESQAITKAPEACWFPAYSPDGKRMLFVREVKGVHQLWVMNADGSDARALVTSKGTCLAGSWSPDGKRITYACDDGGSVMGAGGGRGLKIWAADADGGNARRLTDATEARIDENVPRWSPDGKQIVFTSNRREHYEIWVAEVATGKLMPLTKAYHDHDLNADIEQKVPAWSPDGKRIAYWCGVEMNDPRPNLPRHVWVMRSDGTDQKRLVVGDDPNWSPAGEFIIHSMPVDGRPALGRVHPDGTDAKMLFLINTNRPGQSSWANPK
jgi:Tol biopolymer transport system component